MFILCNKHEKQRCPGDCPAQMLRDIYLSNEHKILSGHAYISPSAFHRYLRCPASPIRDLMTKKRLEYLCAQAELKNGKDDLTTKALVDDVLGRSVQDATIDGTNAHSLLEFSLQYQHTIDFKSDWETKILKNSECEFSDDFKESPSLFDNLFTIIKEQINILRNEKTDFFGSEIWVPLRGLNTWGTMDILYVQGKTLFISDLKTGRQYVSALENEQLMGYACGALDILGWDNFDKVVLSILGLRWKGSLWEASPRDIKDWKIKVLSPAIEACYDYEPKAKVGSHCLYCRAKLNCREWRSQMVFRQEQGYFSDSGVEDLDDKTLVDRFMWSKEIERFQTLAKNEIALRFEGFGFGEGERRVQYVRPLPIKKWEDEKKAVELIKNACKDAEELVKEVPRISPDELELRLGEEKIQGVVATVGRRPYVKMS